MIQDGASSEQEGGCHSTASIHRTCFPDGPETGHWPPILVYEIPLLVLLHHFKLVVFKPVVVHCPITAFGKGYYSKHIFGILKCCVLMKSSFL